MKKEEEEREEEETGGGSVDGDVMSDASVASSEGGEAVDYTAKIFDVGNGVCVGLSRLTLKWFTDGQARTIKEQRQVLDCTANRLFADTEADLHAIKVIYIVHESAYLSEIGKDWTSRTQAERDDRMPFAVKTGYASAANVDALHTVLYNRYKTCMPQPHFILFDLDGFRTYEVRHLEMNLQSKCL